MLSICISAVTLRLWFGEVSVVEAAKGVEGWGGGMSRSEGGEQSKSIIEDAQASQGAWRKSMAPVCHQDACSDCKRHALLA